MEVVVVIHTSTVDLLVISPGALCMEVMVEMEDTPEMTEVTEDHLHHAEITMVEVMEDTEDDLEEVEEDHQEDSETDPSSPTETGTLLMMNISKANDCVSPIILFALCTNASHVYLMIQCCTVYYLNNYRTCQTS